MVERAHADFLGGWFIGQQQIEPVDTELRQQFGEFALVACHVHLFVYPQRGLQQMVSHRFGDRVSHTHLEFQRFCLSSG